MSAFESLYGDQCTLHVSTKGAYNNYLSELVGQVGQSVNRMTLFFQTGHPNQEQIFNELHSVNILTSPHKITVSALS